MLDYSEPVARLIDEFKRLPGIGHKSAQRLAFYILRRPKTEIDAFVESLREVKEKIVFCSTCNNLTDVDPCLYCSNPKRDRVTATFQGSRTIQRVLNIEDPTIPDYLTPTAGGEQKSLGEFYHWNTSNLER